MEETEKRTKKKTVKKDTELIEETNLIEKEEDQLIEEKLDKSESSGFTNNTKEEILEQAKEEIIKPKEVQIGTRVNITMKFGAVKRILPGTIVNMFSNKVVVNLDRGGNITTLKRLVELI